MGRLLGEQTEVTGDHGVVEFDRKENNQRWANKIKVFLESVQVYGDFSKYYSGYPPQDIEDLRL